MAFSLSLSVTLSLGRAMFSLGRHLFVSDWPTVHIMLRRWFCEEVPPGPVWGQGMASPGDKERVAEPRTLPVAHKGDWGLERLAVGGRSLATTSLRAASMGSSSGQALIRKKALTHNLLTSQM